MHKFNTLKQGAVTLLPQHVAQRMVRHVSKRNGWNGAGRYREEVQDNKQSLWNRVSGVCCTGRICSTERFIWRLVSILAYDYSKQWHEDSCRNCIGKLFYRNRNDCSRPRRGNIFRHACGGRNRLLTEVAA